ETYQPDSHLRRPGHQSGCVTGSAQNDALRSEAGSQHALELALCQGLGTHAELGCMTQDGPETVGFDGVMDVGAHESRGQGSVPGCDGSEVVDVGGGAVLVGDTTEQLILHRRS